MKKYDQWMEEMNREQKRKSRDGRSSTNIENKYKPMIRKQEQFLRGRSSVDRDLLKLISYFSFLFSGILFTTKPSRGSES